MREDSLCHHHHLSDRLGVITQVEVLYCIRVQILRDLNKEQLVRAHHLAPNAATVLACMRAVLTDLIKILMCLMFILKDTKTIIFITPHPSPCFTEQREVSLLFEVNMAFPHITHSSIRDHYHPQGLIDSKEFHNHSSHIIISNQLHHHPILSSHQQVTTPVLHAQYPYNE